MRRRCAKAAGIACVVALCAPRAWADGAHLRLHGSARLDAQGVLAEGDEMLLRGTLVDDAGDPIAKGDVAITIGRDGSGGPIAIEGGARAPRSCGDGTASPEPRVAGGAIHVATDATGRFCARVPIAVDRYKVTFAYAGGPLVDGATSEVKVDLGRRACALELSPEPRVLSLDDKTIAIGAVATIEGGGATRPGAGLALTLTNESGASLGAATTDAAGEAHFAIDPSKLGPPGRGELRVTFAGNADVGRATRAAEIERHARVVLDVPGAEPTATGLRLAPGSPEDGVTIDVRARAAGGDVANGSVEAFAGDGVVGAAPIEHGAAKLQLTFAPPEDRAGDVPITLRYAPSAPWYEAGPPGTWMLPVRGPSPLRQTPLVLAGLAVLAWLAAARAARVARARAIPATRPRPQSRGEAKLDLVRAARHASEGWKGRVTDADDGSAVIAARVTIERPAFGRAEVLATVVVEPDGRFVLPPVDSHAGDELAIEAPLHVSLRRPLPPAGELDAQLVLRKRALLARLVAWAKHRGKPFDARPEATPGHVRRAAGEDYRVARWAEAIERAAFAGDEVDAHLEQEIEKLAPPAAPPVKAAAQVIEEKALAHPTKPVG